MSTVYYWRGSSDSPTCGVNDPVFTRRQILQTAYGAFIALQGTSPYVPSPYTIGVGYTSAEFLTQPPASRQVLPVEVAPPEHWDELSDLLRARGFRGRISFWSELNVQR